MAGVAVVLIAGTASAGDAGFVPASGSPAPVGPAPYGIAAADVSGDGVPDFAVPSESANSVFVLFGKRQGRLQAGPPATPVGSDPTSVAASDFNRDGKSDLAVANGGSDNVSILLGKGGGTFSVAPGSPLTAGDGAWFVTTADLNRDQKTDLAVANAFADSVSVFLGDGRGHFSAATGSPIAVGHVPYGIAVADLNGDANPDLAVANQFAGNVSILLGDGSGSFGAAPSSPVTVGTGPSWVAASDLNQDGKVDLAVANQGSDNVSVLLGDGNAGFTAAAGSPIAVGNGPTPLLALDVNGDAHKDLVAANLFDDDLSVLLGDGSGGFTEAASSPFALGDGPSSLASADVNRDGKPDLAAPGNFSDTVTLLLNSS